MSTYGRLSVKRGYSPRRLAITVAAIITAAALGVLMIIRMPGKGHTGPLPAFSEVEIQLASRLRAHVRALASDIGPRSLASPDALERAAAYIENNLASMGFDKLASDHSLIGPVFAFYKYVGSYLLYR